MFRTLLIFTFCLPVFALNDVRVLWIIIDGVRKLEMEGKALDDRGNPIPFEKIFPRLSEWKKSSLYFSNVSIANSAGVSLPGYADLFAGNRQKAIQSNSPLVTDRRSHSPTIFESVKAASEEEVMLFASWSPVCEVATSKGDTVFSKSCGWEKNRDLKGAVFKDSRSDSDTFLEAMREIKEKKPRFVAVQFVDADEEAHLHKTILKKQKTEYGIFHYHQALRQADYYIGRLWDELQELPEYKGKTYLVLTTDHGRDAGPKDWTDHGNCMLCDSFKEVFAVIKGPSTHGKTVQTPYTHLDLAPTIAKIFGIEFPSATGVILAEVFEPARDLTAKKKK